MKLDYNLKLEQTQKLIITPELKLAITLLQYSTLELQEHIQQELVNNPVLEVVEGREEDKEEEEVQEQDEELSPDDFYGSDFPWEEYFRDMGLDSGGGQGAGTSRSLEERPSVENCPGITGTMLEDLLSQLRMLSLSERQYTVAAYLAGNLDRNGYLQGELEDLAGALGIGLDEVERALHVVQKLEPCGVGCRSLQECLMLQLRQAGNTPDLALDIVKHYLPAAADGRYQYLATRLDCDVGAVKEAVDYIRTLNPKPGSLYGEGEETRFIIPDVIVQKVDNEYVVTGNDGSMPQLTISPFYRRMLKSNSVDEQLHTFVKHKIEKAYWLIRSIEQRRVTLFKVSQKIVDIQKTFLEEGIKKLKPLTLKDVAMEVGVHESTVSRASANKYIQTPRGLFPLKFFFSSGLSGDGGTDYSSPSIKVHIKEMVEAEDGDKPFSDQKLTDLLKERGVNISRRTVAKYREELSIPPSYKRRRS